MEAPVALRVVPGAAAVRFWQGWPSSTLGDGASEGFSPSVPYEGQAEHVLRIACRFHYPALPQNRSEAPADLGRRVLALFTVWKLLVGRSRTLGDKQWRDVFPPRIRDLAPLQLSERWVN